MHKVLILLLFLLPTANSFGEVWQDENVSITIPDGWEKNTPPAKDIVFFYMYQEHKVIVSLIVQKNTEGVPAKQATQDYNNAIIKKFNAEIIKSSDSQINKRFASHATIKFNIKDKVAYNKVLTTSYDGTLYSLNAMSVGKTLPEQSKIDEVFRSFTFKHPIKEKTYGTPEIAADITTVILILGIVAFVIIRGKKKSRKFETQP